MKKNKLTQIEIDNVIDKTINLSISLRLMKLNLITEKQFYAIKEKDKIFLLKLFLIKL